MVGRGCVQNDLDYNRATGFFAIGVGKFFSFRPDWHEDDRAKPIVQQYLTALDSAVAAHPEVQRCVVSCTHCGMRFLTTPQNAGRRKLRCLFGCRQWYKRQSSVQRSVAYYRTSGGKQKKQRLNARRRRERPSAGQQEPEESSPASSVHASPQDASAATVEVCLEGVILDESDVAASPVLPYVRTVIRLLDGLELTCAEVVELLHAAMRQHRIDGQTTIPYASFFPQQHPP